MIQEFVQEVTNTIRKELRGMHTAMPGTIVAFDSKKMTATVLPSMKFKKTDGSTINYPQITGVPVVFPQSAGQQCTIAFPIKAGDGCLIIIAEQSIDYWMYGQETSTDLAFDLTNAICIPGLFARANAIMQEACDSNAVIIDVKNARVAVKSGQVQIDAANVKINGNLTVSGGIKSSGDIVSGAGVSLNSHIHSSPDGATSSPL